MVAQETLAEIIQHKTSDPKTFSQRDLAHQSGVSNTTIGRIIQGKRAKPETLKKIAPYIGRSYEELMVIEGYITTDMLQYIKPVENVVMLPVLGEIRGGVPMLADENIIGYKPVEADAISNGDYYYLQVTGDSMAPRIEPGDHVLVRTAATCESGQVAVVLLGEDTATLKRVYYQGDSVVLHSDNGFHHPQFVSVNDVRIIGCVTKIIKEA